MHGFRKNFFRFLVAANVVIGIPALIVYSQPSLVVLGFYLFILPGVVLAMLPTVAAYLLLFSLVWVLFCWLHPGYSIAIGAIAIWFAAMKLPESFNQQSSDALARAQRQNYVSNATLSPLRSLAIEVPQHRSIAHCPDICLLLLYGRDVDRVLIPPAYGEVRTRRKARTTTIAYRLEEASSCPNDKRVVPHLGRPLLFKSDFAKYIREAALTRMAAGECLVREEVALAPAELTLRIIDENNAGKKKFLPGPIPVLSSGLELRAGETLIAREVTQSSGELVAPLHLAFVGMGAWEWAQKKVRKTDIDPVVFLSTHTPFELTLPKGNSPVSVRQQLDRFLAGTAASSEDAAASLTGLYIEQLMQQGPERRDFARLRNLIVDSRLTSFPGLASLARRQSSLAPTLFDAMLDRLPQAASLKRGGPFEELDRLAESLPAELFRRPDPRWDALLADPAARAESTHLVFRLVERGNAAAPQLLAMLNAAPAARETWTKDRSAAIRAFCALGPSASEHLTPLRGYAAAGSIPARIQQWVTWKAMLVALGASLSEFPEAERKSISGLVKNRCGYPLEPKPRGAV